MIALEDFLTATGGTVVGEVRATRFPAFCFDTRRIGPGELFLAVKTERGDGHDWVAEACGRGAGGVVVQQGIELPDCAATVVRVDDTQAALGHWGRWILQEVGAEVVGVTGSTGKTGTKEAIAHTLAGRFPLFHNPDNWNGRYGLPLALGQLRPGHRLAVLEMASDSRGEIADLAAMAPPCVAVVTTVQPAHFEVFGDLDAIAHEKAALIRALPSDGLALLNADDTRVRAMSGQSRAPVLLFGTSADAHLRATDIQLSSEGTRFILHLALPHAHRLPVANGQWPMAVPFLGQHAVLPALAAVGVGLHYGMDVEEIVVRLATLERVPGRLNPLPGAAGSLLLDDSYNASPQAMVAALDVLAALPARRRVAVLGDMAELGTLSDEAHAAVGRRAATVVDRLVTKGERARGIALAAEAAGLPPERIAICYTVDDAVRAASQGLGTGDTVLVKGAGEARMERVAARLLRDPADARALVRQGEAWGVAFPRPTVRPTWLGIDLDAIAGNTRRLKAHVGSHVQVLAVMKADGYGHGAVQVAQTALHNGATWLGVACLPEAEALRAGGIHAPILLMGYTPAWQMRAALALDLRVTLFSLDGARALSQAAGALGRRARVHVKVDTGMHRLGLFPDEVLPFVRALQGLTGIEVEGLFTHFSVADSAERWHSDYTREQIGRFAGVVAGLRAEGIEVPLIHAANSAGTLVWPETHWTMVRPGIALYGIAPSPEVPLPEGFRPALSWKTQVAQVKTLAPGAVVSYGATYRAESERRIAIIPVGYADGFRRAPATWGEVLVRGQRAPLVGRVCMDQAMVDVTAIPGVRQGDEVVLIGTQGTACLTVEEVATRLGTIPYEVVAEILARVPRVG